MWHRINLKLRVFIPLALLMGITIGGGLLTVWTTYRIDYLFTEVLQRHMAAFNTAAALETAMVSQKGFVSYFFQDGDPVWLDRLTAYRRLFRDRLDEARTAADTPALAGIIADIGREYEGYVADKDKVIALYRAGDTERGVLRHREVRARFFQVLALCERFKALHSERIEAVQARVHQQARQLRLASGITILVMTVIGILLAGIIGYQILQPLSRLAEITRKGKAPPDDDNDVVQRLSSGVAGLIAEAGQKETELEKSRESLLQAEKLAVVGKLAAGVAHSVRNPLTSVKMRLFSLDRSLTLTPDQQEDFDVISEEIRHVDAIVGNFLEFSRPPKLAVQHISPSAVVDQAVQLLTHRLRSYDVTVIIARERPLDEVSADPEQLKEVMVNIIVNACEAMDGGGTITIGESLRPAAGAPLAEIRFTDTGPGIPDTVMARIFEPFFTTKDDGTGLGLSIVDRIMREHHGSVTVASTPGLGATFTLSLPTATNP